MRDVEGPGPPASPARETRSTGRLGGQRRRSSSSSRSRRPAGAGDTMGPRAARTGLGPAAARERCEKRAEGGADGEVPARSGPRAEAWGPGNWASHGRRPNKDTRGARRAGHEEKTR